MYAKILVPVDGSPASSAGLTEAIKIAKSQGSEIQLMHVVNDLILDYGYGSGVYGTDALEVLRKAGRSILDAAEGTVRREGIKTNSILLESCGGRAWISFSPRRGPGRPISSSWTPMGAAVWLASSWVVTPRVWCVPVPFR